MTAYLRTIVTFALSRTVADTYTTAQIFRTANLHQKMKNGQIDRHARKKMIDSDISSFIKSKRAKKGHLQCSIHIKLYKQYIQNITSSKVVITNRATLIITGKCFVE